MRSLNANLTAAQKAGSIPWNPFAVDEDYTTRVLEMEIQEKPFGGVGRVVLKNDDLHMNAKDLRGQRCQIGWGYYTSGSGYQYSAAAPMWVIDHKEISYEGQLAVELSLIDIWQKIGLEIILSGGVNLTGTITGQFQPGMWVTGRTSGTKARVVFAGAGYLSLSNFMGVAFTNGEVVESDLYNSTKITVSSQSNWNNGAGPGWKGDTTIYGILSQLLPPIGVPLTLDNSDGIVNVRQPRYYTEAGANYKNLIMDLLARTKSQARVDSNGTVHVFSVVNTPSASYSYALETHAFIKSIRDKRLVLPNQVVVYNSKDLAASTQNIVGVATDAAAVSQYGRTINHLIDIEVQSNTEADEVAASILRKIQMEATSGEIESHVNCGQELFDYVEVVDTRSGLTSYGWVGTITRTYQPDQGVNKQILTLGGLSDAAPLGDNTGWGYAPNYPNTRTPGTDYVPVANSAAAAGNNPIADLAFNVSGRDTFSWLGGYLRFDDGSLLFVPNNSHTMGLDLEYGYIATGTADLQWTPSIGGTQGPGRYLVVEAKRGVTSNDKALVLPYRGIADYNLDSIPDGSYFQRIRRYALTSGGLVNMDNVEDGSTYSKIRGVALSNGYVKLDEVLDGSQYARTHAAALSGGYPLLDQVVEGTYGRVYASYLSNHAVLLKYTVDDINYRLVTDWQKSGAQVAADWFFNLIYAYGVRISTSANASRLQWDSSLKGYRNNSLVWEARGDDGRITIGGYAELANQADGGGITVYGPPGNHGLSFSYYKGWSGLYNIGVDTSSNYGANGLPVLTADGVFQAQGFAITQDFGFFGPRTNSGATLYWQTRNRNNSLVHQGFAPYDDSYGYLGTLINKWYAVYARTGYYEDTIYVGNGFGAGYGIFPQQNNGAYCGHNLRYWSAVYAWDIRYKTTGTFHDEDDVSLVRQMHSGIAEEQGHRILDKKNFHPRTLTDEGEFHSLGNTMGVLVGAIAQMADRLDDLQSQLNLAKE